MRHLITLMSCVMLTGCYVSIGIGKTPPQTCQHKCASVERNPYNLDLWPNYSKDTWGWEMLYDTVILEAGPGLRISNDTIYSDTMFSVGRFMHMDSLMRLRQITLEE